jgi:hypothetical protein
VSEVSLLGGKPDAQAAPKATPTAAPVVGFDDSDVPFWGVDMLTPDQIKTMLEDRNLSEVARRCGLSVITVRRAADGDGDRMTAGKLMVLSDYLESMCSSTKILR